MFCNQCEQTVQGKGCTKVGVCSKEPIISNSMDILIHEMRKASLVALEAREQNIIELRFFHGKTQMEVAEEIHISQAQVSRLEKTALKNMKNYLNR